MIEIRHNEVPKRRFDSGDHRHDLFLAIHYIERESGIDALNGGTSDEWDIIETRGRERQDPWIPFPFRGIPPEAALWSRSVTAQGHYKYSTPDS